MDSESPDPGGGSSNLSQTMEIDQTNNRKRNNTDANLIQSKRPTYSHPTPSIQLNYVTPNFKMKSGFGV
ncbi:unnamed protein product [Euphydryas editha]|uniref:Uncharacterized protein n=1 Tax=Euphydryas editha TaxID=104508 RepID=A0AAU9U1Z5_EUPED|nr:unnamed protein product [Euphydryas editha]